MASAPPPRAYTLALLGDVMLGRLLDQLLPSPLPSPHDARTTVHHLAAYPHLRSYTYSSPWGTTLPLLRSADLLLANLETPLTTHAEKWPNKVFNYRSHPGNVKCLTEAMRDGGGYVSLANNHSLDYSVAGLVETVQSVGDAGVKFAGAGRSRAEAERGAVLSLPRKDGKGEWEVRVWSGSDHPRDWGKVAGFHFVDYGAGTRRRLKELLAEPAHLKIFSVHWGPNYAWRPAGEIRSLARFLVDECGVDIVHGHSSHHVQGVEVSGGKLIVYGCGDFVDDYAVTDGYRNDLSAVWRVGVEEKEEVEGRKGDALEVKRLEVFPTRIKLFQAELLERSDPDHEFVCEKVRALSEEMGTKVRAGLGPEGQLVVDI